MLAVVRFILDALFPPQCVPCGKKLPSSSRFVSACDECVARIPIRSGFICSMCGARQPTLHNECHKSAIVIAAATDYTNREAQMLIHALKYNRVRSTTAPLVHVLMQYIFFAQRTCGTWWISPSLSRSSKRWENRFTKPNLLQKCFIQNYQTNFAYCGNRLNPRYPIADSQNRIRRNKI